jgi:hypothetical protein
VVPKVFKWDWSLHYSRAIRRLIACLIRDSAHLTLGVAGIHVSKVQQAVLVLGPSGIDNLELAGLQYGGSTAAAVLKYKQDHTPPIINPK